LRASLPPSPPAMGFRTSPPLVPPPPIQASFVTKAPQPVPMTASYVVSMPARVSMPSRGGAPMHCSQPSLFRAPHSPKAKASPQAPPQASKAPEPPNEWAYFSDAEMVGLAKQMLRGSISPHLLKKLSRRELVGLLRRSSTSQSPARGGLRQRQNAMGPSMSEARLEDAEKQLALAKAEALASFSQFHVASHSGGVSLEGVSPTVTLPDDELERYLFEEALTSTATSTEKSETSTEQRRALSLDRFIYKLALSVVVLAMSG
ncbi:unnamed protein product, partial [Durusdinium trenchii]